MPGELLQFYKFPHFHGNVFFCKMIKKWGNKKRIVYIKGGFNTYAFSQGLSPSSSHPQVSLPQENTLVVEPPLQLLYLIFLFCSLLVFQLGGGVGEMETKSTKFCKVFSQHLPCILWQTTCNVTHVWTRENMQTICPREKKRKKERKKERKQARIIC